MWPRLKYHPVQRAYWASKKRFNYLPCGRQSGKTELAMRKLVRHLPVVRAWDDPRYFYAGPTYRQCKKVAWGRLLHLIPAEWIAAVSVSELSIRTVFGSELFLVGLDQPQRVEGLILDGGVIDENSDIKPGTFDLSILPTLVWRDGWTDFIGVPKRFGHGAAEYRRKCEAAARGELADSACFTWKSEGVVPQETLELYQSLMDGRDYDEQFNASWVNSEGGVFHAFDREYNVRPCAYNESLPIVVGMDFNVNPMAWVMGHLKGDTFEVFDEVWMRHTNTGASLNVLAGRYEGHKGGWEFYGDASSRGNKTSAYSSDYTQIQEHPAFKKMGRTMHFTTANPPRADRFAATNARIRDGAGQRHFFVDARCKHLIEDLETRVYRPGTRETDDGEDRGHSTDALGYILHRRFPLTFGIQSSGVITIRERSPLPVLGR